MNSYSYNEKIKNPQDLKMGGKAKQVDANIKGLTAYNKLLINGKGRAVKGKFNILGDRYFLNTQTKCPNNNEDRHIIINNKTLGTSMGGPGYDGDVDPNLRGIIPGLVEKMNDLDPFAIINSLTASSSDLDCQKVKILTIDNKHNTKEEEKWVSKLDIKSLHPCVFKLKGEKRGKNPVTNKESKCENFSNIVNKNENDIKNENYSKLPNNKLIKTYNILISIFGVYVIYLLINNRKLNRV